MLKYKGYVGSVEVDVNDDLLFGKLLHIRDLVNYEAETPSGLKIAFESAVDDYLQDCLELGVDPDVPFKGAFNVRVTPELHRDLAICAKSQGKTMNEYVGHVLRRHHDLGTAQAFNSWAHQSVMLHFARNVSGIDHPVKRVRTEKASLAATHVYVKGGDFVVN
ncbi:type II toxin-antitoxin system HicB family antitoxin [Maritimibacter alexandrii]|uniref:type II toxin-antitoxin system HicB family antitoxin n=1 Tax=Maritimibacter alexandrii TaxID=2570355 RepID=UPI001109470C|nr:type II toxin-antitoxin system HicB family antitoxin [Maritimibacter alexandrii]